MNPKTVGGAFYKLVPAICIKNDKLGDISIKGSCFWLGIITEGSALFEINGRTVNAAAPCFICFDETALPLLVKKRGLKCDSVYFDPTFINRNMTFELIHARNYSDTASLHDFFLLSPFTDKSNYVFPIHYECVGSVQKAFCGMEQEFLRQPDWYWSCRSRSYFIELLIILERSYGVFFHRDAVSNSDDIVSARLQKAVLFIESHYQDPLTLHDIAAAAATNHTTLTALFKKEFGKTPIEYLWKHRSAVARKQLEFTSLPLKDIAYRCGFKTVH